MCRKCWWEVKIFHEFYSRIESVHCVTQNNESIFVESVTEHLKISLLTKAESSDYKRCPAEVYHTAEYLRDHFGKSKAGKSPTGIVWLLNFLYRKVQHRPILVIHPYWNIPMKSPAKRNRSGKRKTPILMRLSRLRSHDPRKHHIKRITKVAAEMRLKYSSECDKSFPVGSPTSGS